MDDGLVQLREHVFDQSDGAVELGARLRQEEHGDGQGAGRPGLGEQMLRNLREHTGAVARVIVRRGAAVGETRDGRQRHLQHGVRPLAAGMRDEPYAAGIVLATRVEGRSCLTTKSPLGVGSGLGGSGRRSRHAISPRHSHGRPAGD